jgi:hypothetical protein
MKLLREGDKLAILGMLHTTGYTHSDRFIHCSAGDYTNSLFAEVALIFHRPQLFTLTVSDFCGQTSHDLARGLNDHWIIHRADTVLSLHIGQIFFVRSELIQQLLLAQALNVLHFHD